MSVQQDNQSCYAGYMNPQLRTLLPSTKNQDKPRRKTWEGSTWTCAKRDEVWANPSVYPKNCYKKMYIKCPVLKISTCGCLMSSPTQLITDVDTFFLRWGCRTMEQKNIFNTHLKFHHEKGTLSCSTYFQNTPLFWRTKLMCKWCAHVVQGWRRFAFESNGRLYPQQGRSKCDGLPGCHWDNFRDRRQYLMVFNHQPLEWFCYTGLFSRHLVKTNDIPL